MGAVTRKVQEAVYPFGRRSSGKNPSLSTQVLKAQEGANRIPVRVLVVRGFFFLEGFLLMPFSYD
jgi:hypothetical protein